MKVFVLLAAVWGTLLGFPQSPGSSMGSSSNIDSSSSISIAKARTIAGLLTNIYDLLGERAKDLSSCSFPFTYKNKTYYECTTDHDYYGMFWCSTRTNGSGYHAYNTWRHCKVSDVLPSDDTSVVADQSLDSLGQIADEQQPTPITKDSLATIADGNVPASDIQEPASGTCDVMAVPFNEQCLTFSTEELSWDDAYAACQNQVGRLATLNYPIDVRAYVADNYSSIEYWTGARDTQQNGNWVWTDDEPLDDQFPWDGSVVPSGDPVKSCQVLKDKKYSADDCTIKLPYICETLEKGRSCFVCSQCRYYRDGTWTVCCPAGFEGARKAGYCSPFCGKWPNRYCRGPNGCTKDETQPALIKTGRPPC